MTTAPTFLRGITVDRRILTDNSVTQSVMTGLFDTNGTLIDAGIGAARSNFTSGRISNLSAFRLADGDSPARRQWTGLVDAARAAGTWHAKHDIGEYPSISFRSVTTAPDDVLAFYRNQLNEAERLDELPPSLRRLMDAADEVREGADSGIGGYTEVDATYVQGLWGRYGELIGGATDRL